MASSLTGSKLSANVRQKVYQHDVADATVATYAPAVWRSLAGIKSILAAVMVSSAHAMVTFKLFAGTSSAGAGATSVVEHATPTTADALGDVLYLDAVIEQIKDVLPTATHYAVQIDMDTAAATATLVLTEELDRAYSGLTSDQIA